MLLSIVVPVYGGLVDLLKCIGSLAKTYNPGQAEIILVDDCSVDFDLMDLRRYINLPPKVFRNEKNMGFSYTCNRGAQEAEGDNILFLNSDIQVMPNWFEPLIAMLWQEPKAGIVGPKLVFPPTIHKGKDETGKETQVMDPLAIQSCGGLFDKGKGPFHRYLGWNADDWRVNRAEKVAWTTGAALMIRKDDFLNAGGFDQSYIRGYFEDVDLCMKVRLELGKEIWYCPTSVMTHAVGHSTVVHSPEEQRLLAEIFMENSRLFHSKWNDKIVPDTDAVYVNY